jgi:hypothetical protein
MAHRVPPELFEHVLKWLDAAEYSNGNIPWLSIHERGECSLVCRFWEEKLRRRIFTTLRLRTRQDALSLISFIKADTGELNIRQYIELVIMEQSPSDSTWIHLVTFALRENPQFGIPHPDVILLIGMKEDRAEFRVQVPYGYRTVFGDLPRSIPSSCLGIRSLTMKDLRFKNVYDMLHYLRSLPRTCGFITCSNISLDDGWNVTPSDFTLNARRPSRGLLEEVTVSACDQHWPFIWLLLGSTARYSRNTGSDIQGVVYVQDTDFQGFLSIVQALSPVSEPVVYTKYRSKYVTFLLHRQGI